MQKGLKKVTDSLVDAALQSLWIWLGGAVLTAVAVWVAHVRRTWEPWSLALGVVCGVFLVFVVVGVLSTTREVRARLAAKRSIRADALGRKGWLDFWVEWREAQTKFIGALGDLGAETVKIGNVYSSNTRRLQAATAHTSAEKLPIKMRRLAAKTASQLDKRTVRLGVKQASLRAIADRLAENETGSLRWTVSLPGDHKRENLTTARQAIVGLRESNSGALAGNQEWRATLANANSPTRELDGATSRLIAVVDGIADILRFIDRHCLEMLSIIDEAMP
jgi:hypothetical protein